MVEALLGVILIYVVIALLFLAGLYVAVRLAVLHALRARDVAVADGSWEKDVARRARP
jgi:hypothetical protein